MKKLLASAVFLTLAIPSVAAAANRCPSLGPSAVGYQDMVVNHLEKKAGTRESLGADWNNFGAKIVRRDIGDTQYCDENGNWVMSTTTTAPAEWRPDFYNRICDQQQGTMANGRHTCKQCLDKGGTPWKVGNENLLANVKAVWVCKASWNGCWGGWSWYSRAGYYQGGTWGRFDSCGGRSCSISSGWKNVSSTPRCTSRSGSRNSQGCNGSYGHTNYASLRKRACY